MRDGRIGSIEPHQAFVIAEFLAHAGGKIAGVPGRFRGKILASKLHRQIEFAIGRGHHAVKQIAPRQHVQHFIHQGGLVVHHSDIRRDGQQR